MSTIISVTGLIILWAFIITGYAKGATHWPPSARWLREAACIHRYETRGLPETSAASWHDKRNPQSRGGMQFLPSTWRSVGGHGDPADATKQEQLYRAWLLWDRSGGSWRQWSTARLCGLS